MTAKRLAVRLALTTPTIDPLSMYALPFAEIQGWADAYSEELKHGR